nr:MAG: terminase [Bacteriophage sp.]
MAKKIITENTNLTREELEILAKVPNDVFLFSLFCYVIHPVRGKVRFELYPYQKSVLYQFVKERFNILLKFRQAGITELISMYCLWLAMYHPNKKINIISIKDTTAKKVLKKIKFMYKNLPWYLQTPIINGRAGEFGSASMIEFDNGSFIESIPTSSEAGRSESLSLLVIDEAAIVRWAAQIWAAAFPTLSCLSGSYKIFYKKSIKLPRTKNKYGSEIGTIRMDEIGPKKKGVKDLYDSNLYTLTHTGEWKRILWSQNKGKLKTLLLRDSKGVEIECTPRHRFLTIQGWKKASEILSENLDIIQIDLGIEKLINPPVTNPPKLEKIKPIMGFPRFFVTNLGRVLRKNSKGGFEEVKQHINKRFYYDVGLTKDGKTYTKKVSRLVAQAFIGPIPEGYFVDHIDCNKEHNYVTNLQIITNSENIKRGRDFSIGATLSNIIDKINPVIHGLILALREEYKDKSYAYLSGILKSKYGLDISRRTLNNILNRTPVYLSKLTLIEEKESTIYDVHVEDNHSYITTNGYINHNTGGSAIVNSTPYGVGNFYHSTWVDAIAGGNPFNPIRLYWQMHPERDENWYKQMASALGPKRTAQEIDGDFLSSGNTVFDLADIKAIEDCLSDYPVIKKRFNGQYRQYLEPQSDKEYFIGADVSTGRASDYSAFTCMDKQGEEQAVFKGRIPIDKYAKLLGDTGQLYNWATIAPESNDVGMAVTTKLQDEGYPKLYYYQKMLKKKGKSRPEVDKSPGWLTTQKNRSVIIENLEQDIREEDVIIKDPFFVQEAYTFIYDGLGRPVAMGKHRANNSAIDIDLEGDVYSDDSIFGKAICNHIRKGKTNIIVQPK